ncbi:myosin-G heavy chain-like [Oppia nitens]|uniref:myosin-G heavy chain-like n=1 Tax=Oppia nitens TaxID=1686743 RepID=UPI0023DB3188|nr:myosin-G heavy chain-like [Oppia nitens]
MSANIGLIKANDKCFTNESYNSGQMVVCPPNNPFCCYDLVGVYYCCPQRQLYSVLTTGSIVMTTMLALAIAIATFLATFVRFESIEWFSEESRDMSQNTPTDGGFSTMFETDSPKKDEKQSPTTTTTTTPPQILLGPAIYSPKWMATKLGEAKRQTTTAETLTAAVKSEKIVDYKPKWGKFDDNNNDNKSSDNKTRTSLEKIGFIKKNEKSSEKTALEVKKLIDDSDNNNNKKKDSISNINKTNDNNINDNNNNDRKIVKTKSSTSFQQNVESLKKSIAKK